MTQQPPWHTNDFPELRAGPPWVMEEMVASEPALVKAMAEPSTTAQRLAEMVRNTAETGEPVVITGCGTSEHGAMAIGALLNDALAKELGRSGRVRVRQALEAALDPPEGGLCIGVSHEGGTRATLLALEAAREAGATTALVTAVAGSPATAVADLVLITPELDRSWCHTVAYMSAVLAGGLLASVLGRSSLDGAALEAYLARIHASSPDLDSIADTLGDAALVVTAGFGPDAIAARELALKIEEGARLPAVAYELETLLHGHLAASDRTTGAVFFATAESSSRQTTRLSHALAAAARTGARVSLIASPHHAATTPPDGSPLNRFVLPDAGSVPPLLASLTGSAMALQLLTLALVRIKGVNPDLIRREEAPYRAAAAVAEDNPAW